MPVRIAPAAVHPRDAPQEPLPLLEFTSQLCVEQLFPELQASRPIPTGDAHVGIVIALGFGYLY